MIGKKDVLECSSIMAKLLLSYLELAFKQCVSLHTIAASHNDTTPQRLVSHSPASADRKGKCLFLPLPPSLSDLLPSFPQTYHPPSSSSSSSLSLLQSVSCHVYLHVRAWLNSRLGHDSILESPASCAHTDVEIDKKHNDTTPRKTLRSLGFSTVSSHAASPTPASLHGKHNLCTVKAPVTQRR